MVHLIRDLHCLDVWCEMCDIYKSWNINLNKVINMNDVLSRRILKYRNNLCDMDGYGIFKLIPINPKNIMRYNITNTNLEFIICGLLLLLKENKFHVFNKLSIIIKYKNIIDVIKYINLTIETQFSGGINKFNSNNKRTTGGVFFQLIKINDKEFYNKIENHFKRKKLI